MLRRFLLLCRHQFLKTQQERKKKNNNIIREDDRKRGASTVQEDILPQRCYKQKIN